MRGGREGEAGSFKQARRGSSLSSQRRALTGPEESSSHDGTGPTGWRRVRGPGARGASVGRGPWA